MHPGDRREKARSGVQQSLRWLTSTPYATQFLWFWDFSGEWLPFSFARFRSGVGLISVKLLISPISRHAAKRLDLTGQAWASTETTDLQAKLWIGNGPKLGAACWIESSLLHDDNQEHDCEIFQNSLLINSPAIPHFNPTFTVYPGDTVMGWSFIEQGKGSNFLAARCWWSFPLLTSSTLELLCLHHMKSELLVWTAAAYESYSIWS